MTSRQRGGPNPSNETRIAPRDPSPSNETRIAPRELAPSNETRIAPLDVPSTTEEVLAAAPASNRTTFASQATMFADALRDRFTHKMYGRMPRRVLRVDEPEGPSTAGGLLARQAISLVPRKGAAPTLVCGWMDVSKGEAQLRSYESLTLRHEARYGAEVDLPREDYERFLDELIDILMTGAIRVRVTVPDEKEAAPPPAPEPSPRSSSMFTGQTMLLVGIAFTLGILAERLIHLTERLLSLGLHAR